jgi:3-phosphoshikimate 1-carboxyvinyltransferase
VTARRFEPSGPLRGELVPPPDKSISHRAALLAAMADGKTSVSRTLRSEDTDATLRAVEALGAAVGAERRPDGALDLRVRGIGLTGPGEGQAAGETEIDVGNAGTLLRLLPGWLAGQGRGRWTLDGDASIRRRPVDRVAEPLAEMGAAVSCRDGRLPPLSVEGAELRGIAYRLPVASAQVKSCVLLAGLLAEGETSVVEPAPTRDHTERMLRAAGVPVTVEESSVAVHGPPGHRITVRRADVIRPQAIEVPGDFSSAAFPIVAAVLIAGSGVRTVDVGLNPTRIGLLGVLRRMGAAVEVVEETTRAGEPRGVVVARHGALQATRVGAAEVPLAIDELPLVALLSCFAEGETVVEGAEELRHKESDRIAATVAGLSGLGAEIEERPDGFAVTGTGGLNGGRLDAAGDHRLAMLGAIAGLASRDGVEVEGIESVAVSYPGFEPDLASLIGA